MKDMKLKGVPRFEQPEKMIKAREKGKEDRKAGKPCVPPMLFTKIERSYYRMGWKEGYLYK